MDINILKAKNISKIKKKNLILQNINLNLNSGESVAIVGKSGSGKSTLLSILGLTDTYSSGSLEIFGKEANLMSEKERRIAYRNEIGFVFQDYGLIDEQTVNHNLLNSLKYKDLSKKEKTKCIENILNYFDLSEKKNLRCEMLSGGEKQRIAVIKLLLKKPKLILADEPTGSLDKVNGMIVIKELLKMCDEGCGMIIVTHDLEIASMMDSCIYLDVESVLL